MKHYLALLKSGLLDGYYEDVNCWDMAAAALITREAGATATQYQEMTEHEQVPADLRSKRLLVANPELFSHLQKLLKQPL